MTQIIYTPRGIKTDRIIAADRRYCCSAAESAQAVTKEQVVKTKVCIGRTTSKFCVFVGQIFTVYDNELNDWCWGFLTRRMYQQSICCRNGIKKSDNTCKLYSGPKSEFSLEWP
jgi:hypothetical protein